MYFIWGQILFLWMHYLQNCFFFGIKKRKKSLRVISVASDKYYITRRRQNKLKLTWSPNQIIWRSTMCVSAVKLIKLFLNQYKVSDMFLHFILHCKGYPYIIHTRKILFSFCWHTGCERHMLQVFKLRIRSPRREHPNTFDSRLR